MVRLLSVALGALTRSLSGRDVLLGHARHYAPFEKRGISFGCLWSSLDRVSSGRCGSRAEPPSTACLRRVGRQNAAVQRFSDELLARFPDRLHVFDDYQKQVGAMENAFREYADIASAEERLLRVTRKLTARRLVAIQATNTATRAVNLANGLVLLLNRRHAHAAPAVARALYETCAMAVYADRRLAPLLSKRHSPKRIDDAHRLLFRLGLGTDGRSETSHIRARRGYSILSELTHPNTLGTTLSRARDSEWILQPEIGRTVMAATLRPSWIALTAARSALRDLVQTATAHPMEFPDADPRFSADEINPRTRIW